jgi:hypothetical protein
MLEDLARPHPFAAERVGFAAGRIGTLPGDDRMVLLTRYTPVPDEQYLDAPDVGACIGSDAIVTATQAVYTGRARREGVFHVHMHPNLGAPRMSSTDSREIPKLMPGFQSVGPDAPHGIVIWSRDHGSAWVWLAGAKAPVAADSIAIVGAPIAVFEQRRSA